MNSQAFGLQRNYSKRDVKKAFARIIRAVHTDKCVKSINIDMDIMTSATRCALVMNTDLQKRAIPDSDPDGDGDGGGDGGGGGGANGGGGADSGGDGGGGADGGGGGGGGGGGMGVVEI